MPQDSPEITEIFSFWAELFAPRSRLDDQRRALIADRLADGYSVEDLKLACLGCSSSAWHMGANERGRRYCSIDLICRSAEKVDQFVEFAEEEARRLAHNAALLASMRPYKPHIPMPDNVRANFLALLGRHAKGLKDKA